ncbi:hypothetical protein CJ030_MR8G023504 [Morella rubra]|uniref:Uncharacterized protein n=1 Tax=Morella rubra TaxID=262757 RepID=A0A6A1UTH7_9ROSI|nr:hypothetical protein CJ030_MR8G023504 [Morella rubra]
MASPTNSEQPTPSSPNPITIQENQQTPDDSQSPKSLTLETLNPHQDDANPQNPLKHNQFEDDPEPLSAQTFRITDPRVSSTGPRRAPKRKKKAQKHRLARVKYQKKLKTLVEILKPIPFVPSKTLDFQRHEKLLKRLGLWDFVHIDFDKTLRADLLAELIANYNPRQRCSYVNSARVNVNRAVLARALKLPVPTKKSAAPPDTVAEAPESVAGSVGFIEDFLSNWVLLHEDTWMMPNEVLNWTKVIKEGLFEKVDWSSLIWFMVEKELVQAPNLENCYYASHLQYLIRSQREDLLKEEPQVDEAEVKEEEEEEEEEDEEEVDGSGDVKMGAVEDSQGPEMGDLKMGAAEDSRGPELWELKMDAADKISEAEDSRGPELCDLKTDAAEDSRGKEEEESSFDLSLEQHNAERVEEKVERVEKVESVETEKEHVGDEDVMHLDECREEYKDEDGGPWVLDRKSNAGDLGEPFLTRCSMGEGKGLGRDEEKRDEAEEEAEEVEQEEREEEEERLQEDSGFHLSPKCNPLEGLATGSLIQAMEATHIAFSSGLELRDHSPVDFLSSRDDNRLLPGGSSPFGNSNKKGVDHEVDNIHHPLNGAQKMLRIDGPWDGKLAGFDICVEQVQDLLGKARMMYAAKERACEEATVNQQILLNELQQRDSLIEHLRTTKLEEQQKRQVEMYRVEHELYMMANLLEGYRKALKESDSAFAEYRARCPQPEEPLYKDVPGSGGLVLSIFELEKQRLKQEEEDRINRLVIEKKIKDFEVGWKSKFEAHCERVDLLGNRLLDVENGVKLLKESFAKRGGLETSEGAPDQ